MCSDLLPGFVGSRKNSSELQRAAISDSSCSAGAGCAVKWGENATAGEIVTLVMSAWRKPERWLLVALIFSRSFQSETSHFFVLLFEEEGGSSLQCLL